MFFMRVLPAWVYVHHMRVPCPQAWDPLELELRMVVSHRMSPQQEQILTEP